MNKTTTGIIAAVAIIAAFTAGSMIEIEDGDIALESPVASDGPLEQVGEALDNAADQ